MSNNLNISNLNAISVISTNTITTNNTITNLNTTNTITNNNTITNLNATNTITTNITSGNLRVTSVFANNFIGMIAPFAVSTIPSGWLYCDGSTVSRTSYAGLFAVISTTWGAGNSTSTFSLPDFRGVFMRGIGTGSYGGLTKGGFSLGTYGQDQVQQHTHPVSLYGIASDGGNNYHWLVKMEQLGDGWVMKNVQEGLASYGMTAYGYGTARFGYETQPYCVGVKYCIKY